MTAKLDSRKILYMKFNAFVVNTDDYKTTVHNHAKHYSSTKAVIRNIVLGIRGIFSPPFLPIPFLSPAIKWHSNPAGGLA